MLNEILLLLAKGKHLIALILGWFTIISDKTYTFTLSQIIISFFISLSAHTYAVMPYCIEQKYPDWAIYGISFCTAAVVIYIAKYLPSWSNSLFIFINEKLIEKIKSIISDKLG